MVTKAEWDALEKRLHDWLRRRVTCGDCRQLIEPWELRTQLGETFYHADRCGPENSR
jgi:hypothetical protein